MALLLWLGRKGVLKLGQTLWLYVFYYGVGRLFIEMFLRIDTSEMLWGVRIHVWTARLVAGAAWAAPVVVASSVIPAYAASDEEGECTGPYEDSTMITAGDGVKKVAVLTVPAGLTHALSQQSLTNHVINLVATRVIQVLTLEEHTRTSMLRELRNLSQQRRTVRILSRKTLELGNELGVVLRGGR